MKSYLKYKNFIPREFIEEKEKNESQKNKRGYKALVVINIILFWFNVGNISEKSNDNKEVVEKVEKYIKKEEVIKWLELYDEDNIEFKVVNNSAEITYDKNKEIKEVESLGIKIKKIINYEDKRIVSVEYE